MADPAVAFFRYRDAAGRDVITNDLNEVPLELRGKVEVVMSGDPSPRERDAARVHATMGRARASFDAAPVFHGPSFALGAVVAFAGAYLVFGMRGARRALVRIAVVVAGVVALGALYFGWVMRTAGLDHGALANPAAAIDEARAARGLVEERHDQVRRIDEALGREQ
ncbi:MAG: hypothetical protein IT383_23890 [Deltaproteobacteria bacterium]|nr:hypothetical protein [Deltaproteobacteria bacterium]